ncbi:hypothetical protein MNBD_GAMMA10-2681 [hydrothermal vent metagenome]|uniref:Lipoprotein n=1 Tax=hydrothermal vent metagenome TaxID=652676 RepID=A0A3B0Y7M6_9ZZZZ
MKKYLHDIKRLLTTSLLCSVCLLSGCDLMYIMTVSAGCAMRSDLSAIPEKLPIAVVGEPYKFELIVEGDGAPIVSVSVIQGELPPGLQLMRQDGEHVFEITGIAQKEGDYAFTIKMTGSGTQCVGPTGEQDFIVRVKPRKIS